MGKKEAADRKARLEQIRREQQAVERRRTLLVLGTAGVLVLVLVGAVFVVIRNQIAASDITKVGLTAAAANCSAPTSDPTSGSGNHVGVGTNQPNVTSVKYSTVPPTSGEHFASPEVPARAFYDTTDRPAVETLVHNQEHGYTVLWYDPSVTAAQKAELEKIATLARKPKVAGDKFIVAPLDTTRGSLPDGKKIALAHWGAKQGHRQICAGVSGTVVQDFVKKYPSTDAPEPNGQ
ncbi:DUF3105 domain-containing protein [Spongisporangium articulatum]|uniref:DUF3105 domain-containing protein n=1 Tax=Spongisporangium articulatum TaxID=3362603 RepID=A0ABW8APV0_9ACTN